MPFSLCKSSLYITDSNALSSASQAFPLIHCLLTVPMVIFCLRKDRSFYVVRSLSSGLFYCKWSPCTVLHCPFEDCEEEFSPFPFHGWWKLPHPASSGFVGTKGPDLIFTRPPWPLMAEASSDVHAMREVCELPCPTCLGTTAGFKLPMKL